MSLFSSLPPPPNGQSIADIDTKKDKDQKITEVKPRTNWTWQDWFQRLWEKLSTITVLPTLGSSNQLLGVNSAGTDLEYKTLGVQSVAGTLPAVSGGTGFSSYAVGDLLYANTTTTLARLADVATGQILKSGGIGVAPAWGTFSATGDATGTYEAAGLPLTLATVNANVGTFGSSSQVGQFTVNAKGLITAAANITITPSAIGAQAAIQFQDEGVNLGTSGTVTVVDFIGAGITVSRASNTVTVNVPTPDLGDVFAFAAAHG